MFGALFGKKKAENAAFVKMLEDGARRADEILARVAAAESAVKTAIENAAGEILARAAAIESRQKEAVMQLEELDGLINDGFGLNDAAGESAGALLALADIVYDFYCYSKKTGGADQARMMWQAALLALKKDGLEALDPQEGDAFSYVLHVAHGALAKPGVPGGCVAETLNVGYVKGDRILRRAAVLVSGPA